MRIGIFVHSQTGNTYGVALKLKEQLTTNGHTVDLERLNIPDAVQPGTAVTFAALPDFQKYDALVFGAPVQGFSLSPGMTSFLQQVGPIQNKKAACLMTQHFPYPWMGGNRAIGQMKTLCESKGATPCATAIVNWKNKRREQQIANGIARICASL